MSASVDLILSVITQPETAFRHARGRGERAQTQRWLLAICWSVLLSLLVTFERRLAPVQLVLLLIVSYFALLFVAALKTMWTQFFAARLGAEGRVLDLFFLLALCLLPFHLTLPAALIAQSLKLPVLLPTWIAAIAWSGSLWLKAVQSHARLSRRESFSVAFTPATLLTLGGLALLVLTAFLLASLAGVN